MRILCVGVSLPKNLEQLEPVREVGKWAWPVELNAQYIALSIDQGSGGLWSVTFEHHEREMPVSAPLALFDVIEPSVPRSWNVRVKDDAVSLQPNEFDDPFFCDDVQERRGDALERYRAMKARFKGE